MQCKCGDEIVLSIHTVTTEKGAATWIQPPLFPVKPPLDIHQRTCKGCGRHGFQAYDEKGSLVASRNL